MERDATIDFEKLPVDASIAMPDEAMDLIEPYDYKALEDFQTKYMSGFFAEKYNMDATELGPRAKDKAKADAKAIMNKTVTGYSTITNRTDNVTMDEKKADYALLPVWCYSYKYKGEGLPVQNEWADRQDRRQTARLLGKSLGLRGNGIWLYICNPCNDHAAGGGIII